ncbi:acyl-CoA synthetase family protein [Francisella frigiditurris]|uniref:AMP-binding enzyme family protein n=1 Tax=Francisella frigiditurris TaxID=1542390 RepID=A0A1J0KW42_9GAMM|nr:AMP-binding protein [Francisella frigiditurris]APC97844.1 AMP-binding enzyme family protein [Francisella frigiditurris]
MNKNKNLTFVSQFEYLYLNLDQIIFLDEEVKIDSKTFIKNVTTLSVIWEKKFYEKDRVALVIDNFYLFICAWFACQILRKTVVILPNNQTGTLELLSKYYDIVIYDEDVKFNSKFINKYKTLDISLCTETIFFTSGSSGDYQAYSRTIKELENESSAIDKCLNNYISKKAIVYATVSHQHLYGFSFYFLWAFLSGHLIQTQRLISPEGILNRLVKNDALIVTTPIMISHLDKPSIIGDDTLVLSSASTLSREDALSFFNKYKKEVLEVYGSTETGVIAYRKQLEQPDWKCFYGVDISTDINSQLIVKSNFFSNSEQLMADKVELKENNSFTLIGRVDRIVKLAGKRLSLSAMETYLKLHPWIKDSSCILCKSYREYVGTLLVLSEEGMLSFNSLGKALFTRQLKSYLLDYYSLEILPKKWRIVSRIPVNTQGKRVLANILKEFE